MIKILAILSILSLLTSFKSADNKWISEKHKNYTIYYTQTDDQYRKEYLQLIDSGINTVEEFFGQSFKNDFAIYIHPDRLSLDSTWQTDWEMPDFKSECWMVGSGVASKLDLISPKEWDKVSCEHKYSDIPKTQQLITHELVHVFHGQFNASPDFSDAEGTEWFVEGLATYASGQCDSTQMAEVKKALAAGQTPDTLEKFWTGKLKYYLSGSMVKFIDTKYGRNKLLELLPFTKKSEILHVLQLTETEMLNAWADYISKPGSF